MNTFISLLRAVANELRPFVKLSSPNSLTWNGDAYVRGGHQTPDPYALAWWTRLTTIADLLETQESNITPNQLSYLEHVLFGGAGGLNDFYLDKTFVGELAAGIANKAIRNKTTQLFESFQLLKSTQHNE